MTYRVRFSARACKAMRKLDPATTRLILAWVRKNLEGCADPRKHGKGLTGNFSGTWRYRIGDYRLIADIQDRDLVVLVVVVGHRRDVY